MNPRFEMFEDTKKTQFNELKCGDKFMIDGRKWTCAQGVGECWPGKGVSDAYVRAFDGDTIVNITCELETKSLDNCLPGDVVDDNHGNRYIVGDSSGSLFNIESFNVEVVLDSDECMVTVVGKVVRDD